MNAHLLEIFGFLPVIGPAVRFLALLLAFFGVWIGVSTAHELRGWRTLLLPVIFIATTVITVVFLAGVIEGTTLAVDSLLQDFGIEAAPDDTLAELNHAWHRLDPWPDAVAGLQRLKQRYILAPHSNGNIALLVNMAKRAGLPWDVILGAEVVRAYKPLPESYQRAASALGRAPAQCMMVAAHNGDLLAAQAQGLQTAFVPRPNEHGAQQKTDLTPTGDWTIVAADFADLAVQLGV